MVHSNCANRANSVSFTSAFAPVMPPNSRSVKWTITPINETGFAVPESEFKRYIAISLIESLRPFSFEELRLADYLCGDKGGYEVSKMAVKKSLEKSFDEASAKVTSESSSSNGTEQQQSRLDGNLGKPVLPYPFGGAVQQKSEMPPFGCPVERQSQPSPFSIIAQQKSQPSPFGGSVQQKPQPSPFGNAQPTPQSVPFGSTAQQPSQQSLFDGGAQQTHPSQFGNQKSEPFAFGGENRQSQKSPLGGAPRESQSSPSGDQDPQPPLSGEQKSQPLLSDGQHSPPSLPSPQKLQPSRSNGSSSNAPSLLPQPTLTNNAFIAMLLSMDMSTAFILLSLLTVWLIIINFFFLWFILLNLFFAFFVFFSLRRFGVLRIRKEIQDTNNGINGDKTE